MALRTLGAALLQPIAAARTTRRMHVTEDSVTRRVPASHLPPSPSAAPPLVSGTLHPPVPGSGTLQPPCPRQWYSPLPRGRGVRKPPAEGWSGPSCGGRGRPTEPRDSSRPRGAHHGLVPQRAQPRLGQTPLAAKPLPGNASAAPTSVIGAEPRGPEAEALGGEEGK